MRLRQGKAPGGNVFIGGAALMLVLVCVTTVTSVLAEEALDYLPAIESADDFALVSTAGDGRTSIERITKYVVPVSDDPDLLPAMFQNVNRYPMHLDFLTAVFPEHFAGLSIWEYIALTQRRDTRSYYTGAIYRFADRSEGTVYAFDVYTSSLRSEQLRMAETQDLYQQLGQLFALRPFRYTPGNELAREVASEWESPPFPVYFADTEPVPDYIAYTQGTTYGRIRLVDVATVEESEGQLSWQDIVVVDAAPSDIQDVVAGVITGSPQGELSHVAIRTARRGTPNAYMRDAVSQLRQYAGELVLLEVGEDGISVDPEIAPAEARQWWDSHRPILAKITRPDYDYTGLDSLLDMQTDGSLRSPAARVGGKAANLARMYAFLPAEHQVPGFAIPFHYYRQLMRSNHITDDLGSQAVERTYEEYLQRLLDDPRFQTDASFRSQRLQAFRKHLREHAALDTGLLAALAQRIASVFGSTEVMVRFRSSSNIEDSLLFNGAGLYDSTSVCAADSVDADNDGPSRCWAPQDRERSIERGLKKVWASLWNYRAVEERSYFQVPDHQAAMAILVTTAFPDEAANGVAFTGFPTGSVQKKGCAGLPKVNDRSWPPWMRTYLVNAQIGDHSVVSPEAFTLPETDVLILYGGGVSLIRRSRRSSLMPYGEWVLSDTQLELLGSAMYTVDAEMPIDLLGYAREDVLLDIEWKLTQEGGIIFKQVRPFLAAEVQAPTADDYYRLVIPSGTTLCGVSRQGRGVATEHRLLTQVDLVAGTLLLPKHPAGPWQVDMVGELRFGPEQLVAQASSVATVTSGLDGAQSFEQELQAGATSLSLDMLVAFDEERPRQIVLDEAFITRALRFSGRAGSEHLDLSSCSLRQAPAWEIRTELDNGDRLSFELRRLSVTGEPDLENLVSGEVIIDGTTAAQSDYWSLVHARDSSGLEQLQLLLDVPIGDVHAVTVSEEATGTYTVTYLDEQLQELRRPGVLSLQHRPVVPRIDDLPDLRRIIPAAAHSAGAAGTSWVTDLVLYSPASAVTDAIDANLYLLSGDPGGMSGQQRTIPVATSLLLGDVVRDTFGHTDNLGAVVVGGTPLVIGSRTYTTTAAGTYGQYIPAIPEHDAYGGDEQAVLIQLTANRRYRTNLGIVDLGVLDPQGYPAEITYTVDLYHSSGTQLGRRSHTLSVEQPFIQDNRVFTKVSGNDVDDGWAVVRADDPRARFLAYASVIDEGSGDPVLVLPTVADNRELYVPAAAHTAGVNGTTWRTDLQLLNPDPGQTVRARIELLEPMQDNRAARSVELSLPAGRAVRSVDLLGGLLPYDGAAALRIIPLDGGRLHAGSRTYNDRTNNDLGSMTYGQLVPALAPERAVDGDHDGLLVQLAHSPRSDQGFRTNLGLVNASAAAVEVRVTLSMDNGSQTPWFRTLRLTLPPYGFHQENNVFAGLQRELRDGTARIEALGTPDQHVFAYASVVDNLSGDPVLITASPVARTDVSSLRR